MQRECQDIDFLTQKRTDLLKVVSFVIVCFNDI